MRNLHLFLSIFFITIQANSQAQFYKPLCAKAFEATSRPVLVESDGFLCFDNLQEAVAENWKFNTDVKVKSASEIDQTIAANPNGKWVILSAGFRNEVKTVQGKMVSIKSYVVSLHLSEDANFRSGKDVDKRFLYKMGFPSCVNSDVELMLFLKNAQSQIKEMAPQEMSSKSMKKFNESVASATAGTEKVLLLPKDQVLISESEIKAAYPNPFKLVSREEIHTKIELGSATEMVLNIVWSDKKMNWALMAFDLESYQVNLTYPLRTYKPKVTKLSVAVGAILAIEKEAKKVTIKELQKLAANATKIITAK